MSSRFAQVIKDWTIRRKILTGFARGAGADRAARLAGAWTRSARMSRLGAGDFAGAEQIVARLARARS